MESLGKFFTGVILLIIGIMISGFVVMKFWGWFVITTITMSAGPMGVCLNPLTFAQAIVLSMFITLLSRKPKSDPDETFADTVGHWFVSMLYIAVIFVIGWITHLIIF